MAKNNYCFRLMSLLLVIVMGVLLCGCSNSEEKIYKNAMDLYDLGEYSEAEELFASIPEHESAGEMVKECKYQRANMYYDSKEYTEAYNLFTSIPDYKSSDYMIRKCKLISMARFQYAWGIYQLKDQLKNPSSLQIYGVEFEPYTFTYEGKEELAINIVFDYSGQNSFGGTVRDTIKIIGATVSDDKQQFFLDNIDSLNPIWDYLKDIDYSSSDFDWFDYDYNLKD